MSIVLTIILAVQMLSALGMIGLILVQHGKGADMGAAFGSGGSGSLFGASGSANFLSRTTGVLAAVFFACTLLLAYFGNSQPRAGSSVLDGTPASSPIQPASGAGQIPGTNMPATAPATSTPAAPAKPASGAGQIPTK
jgi:preprotein translocase subunit SecG